MIVEPICTIDDVRYTLGMWLLSQEELTPSKAVKMIVAAKELAAYTDCVLRLRDVTEQGFAMSYFAPQLRDAIRGILDEMDGIGAGTQETIRKRNETLRTRGTK